MTSVRGRKPLPLPPSVMQALESSGFAQSLQGGEPRPWRQWWGATEITLVKSNLPGSTEVVIRVESSPPLLVGADVAAAMIALHSVPRRG